MLTCCGCIANPEQTQILTPCQLHAAWAKTYAAQTWGDGPDYARQAQPTSGVQPGAVARVTVRRR